MAKEKNTEWWCPLIIFLLGIGLLATLITHNKIISKCENEKDKIINDDRMFLDASMSTLDSCRDREVALQKENEALKSEQNKATVWVSLAVDFAQNLYNPNQIFFKYFIYNFGNEEAKGLTVKCRLYDTNNNIAVTKTEKIGNIASNSYSYKEMIANYIPKAATEYYATCFVSGCDGCTILHKKISGLIEE